MLLLYDYHCYTFHVFIKDALVRSTHVEKIFPFPTVAPKYVSVQKEGVVSLEQGMNEKESCTEFPDDWQNKTVVAIFSENCQRKFEMEDWDPFLPT